MDDFKRDEVASIGRASYGRGADDLAEYILRHTRLEPEGKVRMAIDEFMEGRDD